MRPSLALSMIVAVRLEMQLICKRCRLPYHPDKSWEDRYRAVAFGSAQFAICPICTQAPPQEVLDRADYRRRCRGSSQAAHSLRARSEKQRESLNGSPR
jgi:hypothetical protein